MILAEFDQLIRTPADVERLNEAILELAVRGRLVAQDPADEPASALLARIRAEKARLEAAGEIRKSKPLPKVKAEEMAFALPEGWVWTRLGDAGLVNPRNSAPDEMEASFIPMTLIDDGIGSRHDAEIRNWGDIRTGFTHFAEGDVGVAKITPCFQNRKSVIFSGLQNGIGAGTTELHVFRPLVETVDPRYALAFF